MTHDTRREQLEQLTEDGDEAAVAGLWLEYGIDRQATREAR